MTDTKTKQKKIFEAVVVGSKMKDTVTVIVDEYVKHPTYHKFVRRSKKFQVHNPGNTKKVGEKVLVQETRPISKTKHFKVVENNNS